jgi:ATP-dependent DNA ligase
LDSGFGTKCGAPHFAPLLPNTQVLQGIDMGQERPPIVFYAFDLLQLNGKDLRNLPIEERKTKLAELYKTACGNPIFDQLHERHCRAARARCCRRTRLSRLGDA